jgi:dipeptidyl-peptidase-4
VINGTADWVNEEELALRDCFRWSDDGRSLAYWQFDTAGVKDFTLLNTTAGIYPEATRFPYPKVGTINSAVRVGVVPATGGKTRWISLPGDAREHYVPRLSWLKDAPTLAVFRLNRLQNQLDVGLADASSGKVTPFFQDFDPAWVSVREQPLWTHDGRTLLILSERGNWRQLYAVARTDPQPRLITPQPFDVIELVGTDAGDEWVYYLASPEHPAQRHLYRSRLDGSRAPERITPAGLTGTHAYVLAPDGRHAFHTHSTFGRPPATQLVRLPGHEVVRSLEDNQALAAKVAPFARPTEFFTVGGGEGVSLDGWMIRPRDFDPQRRYPVIVFIYGEPANVTVTDAWNGSRVLFHWALADAGYVVLSLDNRGTPAPKGREWRKVIYGEVNVRVAQEQATALQNLLRQRPYLDPTRVGVWGHSGGGSNTLNLLFRAPETYHVGIAIAPVTDQLLYDTIYQERYMGLPAQNPQGYRAGSPIHFAAGLRGKLLLIHGAADDNVHFQNSERLINRLVELQKPFDLMVYPNGSHAVSEGKGYSLHRYQLMARHFLTHLPAGGRP